MKVNTLEESLRDIRNLNNQEILEIPQIFKDTKNNEITINYINTKKIWNRNEMKNINKDKVFYYTIASYIINKNYDPET